MTAHFWDKGRNIQKEIKLLKHTTNTKVLTVWGNLFIKKSEEHVMNFYVPSENRKYSERSPEVFQSETEEDGKNYFLKTFLDFIEFCRH